MIGQTDESLEGSEIFLNEHNELNWFEVASFILDLGNHYRRLLYWFRRI